MTLNDIFPAVVIVEYSLYFFLLLCVVLMAFLYLVYRLWKNKPKGMAYYLNIIESALHTDAKQTTYRLGHYGKYIVKTPEQQEKLTTLVAELKPFRYVPDGTLFTEKTEKKLRVFLQGLRQKNV